MGSNSLLAKPFSISFSQFPHNKNIKNIKKLFCADWFHGFLRVGEFNNIKAETSTTNNNKIYGPSLMYDVFAEWYEYFNLNLRKVSLTF